MLRRHFRARSISASSARASVLVLGALVLLLTAPRQSFAQAGAAPPPKPPQPTKAPKPPNPSHWGINFSMTPSWTIADSIKKIVIEGDGEVNIKGKALTIGFVRGSRRGGDWGVAYVRKPMKDGLAVSTVTTDCFPSGPPSAPTTTCLKDREQDFFDHVAMSGVEVHWWIAIARIKDRVQLGVNIAGGVAKLTGNIRTVEDRDESNFVPNPNGQGGTQVITVKHTDETKPAKEAAPLPIIPLFKLEFEAGVIVLPALKVKFAYGLDIPSKSVRLVVVYLIGAK